MRPSGLGVVVGEGGGLVGQGNEHEPCFLRAYDKETGEVVGEIELPAQVSGAAITIDHEGRQMIVVASSHREHPGELIAFALAKDAR